MVPSLFLAHGSPMLALQDTSYTQFLQDLGQKYNPKTIVVFTAHWESDILTISSSDNTYETIYDFYGFPDELYQIKYSAKGSSRVAALLEERFSANGIPTKRDTTRGLDHGSWTLLSRLYPTADIPVVQVSVNPYLEPDEQLKIGHSLKGLGEEDILIIGSGVTVHNLRAVKWDQTEPEQWAVQFDDWLINTIYNKDIDSLLEYTKFAPNANLAVPRPEHFVPLFIALGSGKLENFQVIHQSYELGTLSYLSLVF